MEEPPDCEYQYICNFYSDCKPIVYAKGMSDCWKYNCLEGIIDGTRIERFINPKPL